MDATLNKPGLLDVVAELTSSGESGRLQITGPGRRGVFFFKNGKLIDARMGPFSGFPAVNLAVSMADATFRFDSTIEPPSTAGLITNNERFLLKERFGIETIDVDTIEAQTGETDGLNLPGPVTTEIALPEDSHPRKDGAAQDSEPKQPGEADVRKGSGVRESRRRAARNLRAVRARNETQAGADQVRNQTVPELPTPIATEQRLDMALPLPEATKHGDRSDSVMALEPAPSESDSGLTTEKTPQEGRPSQASTPASMFASFVMDARTNAGTKLFWTSVILMLVVGGVCSYWLNSYFSGEPSGGTQIKVESNQPANADVEAPVIEGALRGKEATLVMPEYPLSAKNKGVTGKVTVSVLVNKQGLVVSAHALNGDQLLRAAAVTAARQAKFSPEKLVGDKSKIPGTITYSFKL
ncbi:MAG TPA: TonB family protein [Pyrinomonadaceae bacterium]|nr:TonB family protein [Pyrinomonadaceae bacterium]